MCDTKLVTCSKCKEAKERCEFAKDKRMRTGCASVCKRCKCEYAKTYYMKKSLDKKEYRERNHGRIAERDKIYRMEHKDEILSYSKRYKVNNKDIVNACTALRRATQINATPAWANLFFIEEAYHLAKLRTELTGFMWHVDHVIPLRSKVVCGLHAHTNIQVIPKTHNVVKNNRTWPDMPYNTRF